MSFKVGDRVVLVGDLASIYIYRSDKGAVGTVIAHFPGYGTKNQDGYDVMLDRKQQWRCYDEHLAYVSPPIINESVVRSDVEAIWKLVKELDL